MRFMQWQIPLCRHFAAELIFAAEKSNKKPDHIGRAFCYFGSSPNTRVIPSTVMSHHASNVFYILIHSELPPTLIIWKSGRKSGNKISPRP